MSVLTVNLTSIELKFDACVTGHLPTHFNDFGEFTIIFFFKGTKKEFLCITVYEIKL